MRKVRRAAKGVLYLLQVCCREWRLWSSLAFYYYLVILSLITLLNWYCQSLVPSYNNKIDDLLKKEMTTSMQQRQEDKEKNTGTSIP